MPSQDLLLKTLQEWIEVFMRRSMRDFIHHSRGCGLSMSQIGALFYVHRKGSSAVSEISEYLGISNAATSQMLDRLVQQKLIERSEDPQDRRAKKILLTEQGRLTISSSIHARQSWLQELASTLSESEQAQAMAALQILIAKAKIPSSDKSPAESDCVQPGPGSGSSLSD